MLIKATYSNATSVRYMLTQAASQATACMRQRLMLMNVMYMQPKSQLDHSLRIVIFYLVKSGQT